MNMQRHQAETNRILSQYQMDQAHQANQQPGFGDTMLRLGGQLGAAYFTGGMGGLGMAGGMAGASQFGRRR